MKDHLPWPVGSGPPNAPVDAVGLCHEGALLGHCHLIVNQDPIHTGSFQSSSLSAYLTHTLSGCLWEYYGRQSQKPYNIYSSVLKLLWLLHCRNYQVGWFPICIINPCGLFPITFLSFVYLEMVSKITCSINSQALRWGWLAFYFLIFLLAFLNVLGWVVFLFLLSVSNSDPCLQVLHTMAM